ncbi:metallophosphoesterase family protein [Methanobrevibacter oralis]|uniref:3',5'-cyclic adenosine monophosphate phosphodiesterase CpdA n=1 Tax=Methanobrevibacter oralis TaxID=66851 RepID=A0A162FK18_METOA|nr:metallophosphoesterase family protein [Methanobrevibacter oralis]KZX11170.1 3',5'-cyclic adenosine monophosphate phosphodiesterase CpdA [Methanobrevibacter oralis]
MTLIVHISDLHISKVNFDEDLFMMAVDEINHLSPEMIILTGDITDNGYYKEYLQASKLLPFFEAPLFAVPGNHDARNLGYRTFEELIGERSWKLTKDDNFTVIGIDSSSPDENGGQIGIPQHMWLEHQLDDCVINNNFSVVALHHHVVSIPDTGRERNVLSDAGEVLKTLTTHEVDLVLSGHKHVPNIWKINNTIIANAGSLCSEKLRGKNQNSYNVYNISDKSIEIYLHNVGGERLLFDEFLRNSI